MPNTAPIEQRVHVALERSFANLELYLGKILNDLHRDKGIFTVDAFNIARIDKTLRTMQSIFMDNLGYRIGIREQLRGLIELQEQVLAEAGDLGIDSSYTDPSKAAIRMLMVGAETELTQVARSASDDVSQIIRRAVMGGGDPVDLLMNIKNKLKVKDHQAKTLASTTLAAFARTINVRHATDSGVVWYTYRGPMDELTRKFCRMFVDKKFTLRMFEMAAKAFPERQKQPYPAKAWGGGFNCRHSIDALPGRTHLRVPLAEGPYIPAPEVDPGKLTKGKRRGKLRHRELFRARTIRD
jgi:hypothetical protein